MSKTLADMTPEQARELLEQATPGPWVTVGECFIDKDGNERYSPELISSRADGIGRDVMWNTDQAVSWCINSHDPQLAALAPELAAEVLRLHEALSAWIEDERAAETAIHSAYGLRNVTTTHTTIINRINHILNGDTNA